MITEPARSCSYTDANACFPRLMAASVRQTLPAIAVAVLTPIAVSRCPRWRTMVPSSMMAPRTTMLPAFPTTVPAALLGVRHLMVSQGLDISLNRRSLNGGRGDHDESRCTKGRKKTAHCCVPLKNMMFL
jgi:hypothetical protein